MHRNEWVENADRWVAGFLEMFEEGCHKMVKTIYALPITYKLIFLQVNTVLIWRPYPAMWDFLRAQPSEIEFKRA